MGFPGDTIGKEPACQFRKKLTSLSYFYVKSGTGRLGMVRYKSKENLEQIFWPSAFFPVAACISPGCFEWKQCTSWKFFPRDQSLRCPLVGALLPQENAHFSISESLIAAIELMKCNMMSQCLEEEEGEEDSDREIQELKQKIRLRRQQIRTKNLLPGYQEMEHGSEWGCECLFLSLQGFWIRRGTLWASFSAFICSCELLYPSQGFLCCQKYFLYCSDFFFLLDWSPGVHLCSSSDIASKK